MPIRILLADDQELIRHGLRAILLRDRNIEVIGEAINGVEAIAKTVEFSPDVVLMDIRMPLMDGCEATRQIKLDRPHTKILILTSNDSNLDMFASFAAGADGYCLKDTPVQEVISAIETVYEGSSWLDPHIAQLVLRVARGGFTLRSDSSLESETGVQSGSWRSTAALSKAKVVKANDGPPFDLSRREIEVLGLLVEGASNKEIGEKLTISADTVKTHMKHIMGKLQVSDRTKAAIKAIREGIS